MADAEEQTLDDRLADAMIRSAPYLPIAVAAAAVGMGVLRGIGAGVLTLAGGAMLGAISALWTSIRVLSGDAPVSLSEAIDLGSPTALDERKQSILRALKDVQNEHALGKITDEDFQRVSAQYRAEARDLLREIDETLAPARQEAENLVARKLAGEPVTPKKKKGKKAPKPADEPPAEDGQTDPSATDSEPAPEPETKMAEPESKPTTKAEIDPAPKAESKPAEAEARPAEVETKTLACPSCATRNDADAAFCKKCGAKLAA